jgi:hypothetical protein
MKLRSWHVSAALGAILVIAAGGYTVAQQTSPGNEPVVQTPPQEPPPSNVEMPPQEKVPADVAPPTKDGPDVKAPDDKGDQDKADDDNDNGDDDKKSNDDDDDNRKKGDDSKVAKLDGDLADLPATPRPRHGAAIIQALDKITTETMRFEVPVGKAVKYKGLVFIVKSCETSAPEEKLQDSMAYLQVRAEPKVQAGERTSREVFSGWMFASSPGLDALQHPVYDAWLIACKA